MSKREALYSPSNLGALRSYSQDERGVTLTCEHGLIYVGVVAERIVRVRMALGDAFAARRSWDVVPPDDEFAPYPFTVDESPGALTVGAPPLRVTVSREDGRVSFSDTAGRELASDIAPAGWTELPPHDGDPHGVEPALQPALQGLGDGDDEPHRRARTVVRVAKRMAPDEGYYGFGERIGLPDRRGRTLTNWTVDPPFGHNRSLDNLYQAHPAFLALRPGLAWGLYLHSTWFSRFDAGGADWDTLELLTLGGELDYYVLYGPAPADVVERLTYLTGRPALPPLWALGYHQSRWSYMDAGEVRSIAHGFRERGIALDAIHFDIDHMRGYRDFTWDPDRFPDPAGLLADLRAQNIRAVTIIDPGVKADVGGGYAVADDGLAHDAFIKNPDGAPFVGYCWPDAAFFPDFARADARAWWGDQHAGDVAAGVAGIWNDMNEPATFERPFSEGPSPQKPPPTGLPQGTGADRTVHAEVHNLYGLLMSRATYEGLARLRPGERPWILTRSGYTGVQRYAAAWMGDNDAWWEHLESSITQLASMGLCGVPHVGVDIGGFFENASAELYARWVQLGTFYPFMRTHSAAGTRRQEPWSFGERVEAIARDAIALRYRLLPYLYTLAHRAHRTGAPLLRPLLYDFPDDPATHHLHDQLMAGPHLLVAPIYHPGREHRDVYLPRGHWYDFWSGTALDGGQAIVAHAPLERIPVFVRGGAILPLGNRRGSTSEPLTELTLAIYPAGESAWTLIEDDGATDAYARGDIAETTVRVAEAPDHITVVVEARRGPYQPHPRTLLLEVHMERAPTAATLDGTEHTDWRWDEQRRAVLIGWQDDGQQHEFLVQTA